ncbi:hypothetical protein HZF08_14390 [Paenibacillus sp. CGMCC 1.16610]|uniref:hypothetical protein n=1 Tax=Paenibacillus TaxID=44249 RepID=UPI0015EFDBF3|nr:MULTISPECIES: hypothetical protein [Paenibacillus]MBA2939501.1 hypothetical protein [Paenibacillus sp. CGMCC 1.16610]
MTPGEVADLIGCLDEMRGLPKGKVYLVPWTNEWGAEFRKGQIAVVGNCPLFYSSDG